MMGNDRINTIMKKMAATVRLSGKKAKKSDGDLSHKT